MVGALRECGEYVDIVVTGDDVASQAGPMMSPAMYRRLIKPHHARMFAAIRENTKAKIYLHSCGNVYRLIGDFIDVGVELLNPVQVSAGEMGDTARLKREFGDRLSFLGGIDTQWALPFGSRKTSGRRSAGGFAIWLPAADISPPLCIACNPTCRWKTYWRCATR